MTSLEQIELLYKQFDNLCAEIDEFLDIEDYDAALEKVNSKDRLIKQMAMALKTADLPPDKKAYFEAKNREISKKNFELIDNLQQTLNELVIQRSEVKKKLKLKNAYSQTMNQAGSVYFDSEE